MKVIVERDAFCTAMDAAFRAARSAPDIAVLKNVLLTPHDNELSIRATNLSMWATAKIPAEITGKTIPIAVIGDALDRITGLYANGSQITFEWDEGGPAIVSCGRSRYKLHTLPAQDFPEFQTPSGETKFSMAGTDFATALNKVLFAVEQPSGRFYLTGVYLHIDDGKHAAFGNSSEKRLLFVATNGGEFARASVPIPLGAETIPGIIIPGETVSEIVRQCKNVAGEVEVTVSKNLIGVTVGKVSFASKLVDATYPNFKRAVPEGGNIQAVFDSKDMLQVLARLASIGGENRASIKLTPGQMHFAARSSAAGDAEEVLEVEFDGEPIDFGIKISGWKECIEAAAAEVCVLTTTRDLPCLINPRRDDAVDYSSTFLSMKLQHQ